MTNYAMTTIGMDLGDIWSVLCVLDESGEVVEQSRVRTRRKELHAHFATRSRTRVVLEIGTHSPWVSRLLEELGHEVIVANARRVRAIAESQRKTDENDAELLARLGRADPKLLAPLAHRKEETQADLVVVRARDALVKTRTALINSVRGQVKSLGGRLPSRNPGCFHTLAETLPEQPRGDCRCRAVRASSGGIPTAPHARTEPAPTTSQPVLSPRAAPLQPVRTNHDHLIEPSAHAASRAGRLGRRAAPLLSLSRIGSMSRFSGLRAVHRGSCPRLAAPAAKICPGRRGGRAGRVRAAMGDVPSQIEAPGDRTAHPTPPLAWPQQAAHDRAGRGRHRRSKCRAMARGDGSPSTDEAARPFESTAAPLALSELRGCLRSSHERRH